MSVNWIAFPLHPETPLEGRSLKDLFEGRHVDIEGVLSQLEEVAGKLGLPFARREKTYNSRLAQELGKWAEEKQRGDKFHLAAFKAYFAEGKNLALTEVLLDLAESVGLEREQASHVLTHRTYASLVDQDWQRSRMKEIRAVPTFIMQDRRLVGAQSYAALKSLVEGGGRVPVI